MRWAVSFLGLWAAATILGGERLGLDSGLKTALVAGIFLALANMFIRPLLVFLSFPAVVLSLGLFMFIINGFMLLIVSWLYSSLYIKNFGVAVIAGVILGIVNFLISRMIREA